ncbi:MAG: hypothetical protein EP310_07125 [Bacteroidetes bacterium]|nr:MAG: hypothetical protein EP310_07125 [Bacteroidota bacterium]
MNDHKEIWSGVFQLKSVFKKFAENLSRLKALKTDHEMDLHPLLDAVSEKRESLIVRVNPVANITLAYARDHKKKELIKKLKLSINKLTGSNDLDLIENSKVIYKVAKKLIKKSVTETEDSDNKSVSIVDYGLNEKMVIDLNVAKKDFVKSLLAMHEAIQNKVMIGKQITSILKKNERLVKNKMDLLLTIFATSKTDFYKTYLESRVIQKNEIVKIKGKKGKKTKKAELPEDEEITR